MFSSAGFVAGLNLHGYEENELRFNSKFPYVWHEKMILHLWSETELGVSLENMT